MLGSAEVCADGDQHQTHFKQATSLVFYTTLLLLVLLFYFSIEQPLASRPSQSRGFPLCCALSFPGCEGIPVAEELAAGAQRGVCPHPSIRGKHKGLHRHLQPAANTQTVLGQEFCFGKALQNTAVLFSLSSCTRHGFRNGEIPQSCVYLHQTTRALHLHNA